MTVRRSLGRGVCLGWYNDFGKRRRLSRRDQRVVSSRSENNNNGRAEEEAVRGKKGAGRAGERVSREDTAQASRGVGAAGWAAWAQAGGRELAVPPSEYIVWHLAGWHPLAIAKHKRANRVKLSNWQTHPTLSSPKSTAGPLRTRSQSGVHHSTSQARPRNQHGRQQRARAASRAELFLT